MSHLQVSINIELLEFLLYSTTIFLSIKIPGYTNALLLMPATTRWFIMVPPSRVADYKDEGILWLEAQVSSKILKDDDEVIFGTKPNNILVTEFLPAKCR